MKYFLLFFLSVVNCVGASAQIEVPNKAIISANKWVITPAKGLKKGMGRLNLNFPEGAYWSVDIYKGNKFITNRSIETSKLKHYDLVPGQYHFKLNTVVIENVEIKEGQTTTLRTGVLEINSDDWELRNGDGKKYLTSGNKPKKIALPAGNYQLEEGNIKKIVEVIADVQFNPNILVDDQPQYIVTPVSPNSDTAVSNKGRLNLNFYFPLAMGQVFDFVVAVFEKGTGSKVCECGYPFPCKDYCFLPEGQYKVQVWWHEGYPEGSLVIFNNFVIEDLPIRKGFETRFKTGYIELVTRGKYTFFNETKEIKYLSFDSKYKLKRLIPVGKYVLNQLEVGDFPVEITDGNTFTLNTIPSDFVNSRKYRIVPTTAKGLKPNKGRLDCEFPQADSVSLKVYLPQPNGEEKLVNLSNLKFIDLNPGFYRVLLHHQSLQVKIEKGKETKIISAYIKNTKAHRVLIYEAINVGGIFFPPGKTMPLPAGYYFYSTNGSNHQPGNLFILTENEVKTFQ